MLRFTGILVLLALKYCYGQPTHDDSVFNDFGQCEDGHELLGQMIHLQRVIVHQEQQQRAQDERMERLEQMLNESIEGQRRLEMQVAQLQQQHNEGRLIGHIRGRLCHLVDGGKSPIVPFVSFLSPPLYWFLSPFPFLWLSLPSARQHPSCGDCLEVKREYYQNSSVLDCVTQCSQSTAHLCEQFLQVKQIGFVTLGPLRCA